MATIPKIRAGNKFDYVWAIQRNGVAEDLTTATDIKLSYSIGKMCEPSTEIQFEIVDDNKIQSEHLHNITGTYNLQLSYTKDGKPNTIDVDAFTIVPRSALADDSTEFAVTSDMAIGFKGENAYEYAVEGGYLGTEAEFYIDVAKVSEIDSKVPYTGATADVDLGVHSIAESGLKLNTVNPLVVANPGDIGWNQAEGTIDLRLLNNTTLQVGQEIYFYGKAIETIANGNPVMIAGVQGNHLTFKKAVYSELSVYPQKFLGIATQNIANNAFGYVTIFGKVNDVFTTGFADADNLYINPANSLLTNVQPQAPNLIIRIGSVIKLATGAAENGIIGVRPTFGIRMTDLNDVNGTPLTVSGQFAVWDNILKVFDFTKNANDFELKSNKQNSLAVDGTGTKFPTVDAVNSKFSSIHGALIGEFTYSGNKEVAVTSVDLATGTFTKTAHGFTNGNIICPLLNLDANLAFPLFVFPTGLDCIIYYVVNATADTFKISLTSGGSAITFTANADMDLTKWHFEKPFDWFSVTGLSEKAIKVIYTGRTLGTNLSITPDINAYWNMNTWQELGNINFLSVNGSVYVNVEIYIYVNNKMSYQAIGQAYNTLSKSKNKYKQIDFRAIRMINNTETITNITVPSSENSINGNKISIYRL